MTRPASPYAALAQTVGVASAPAAYVAPPETPPGPALVVLEIILNHARRYGPEATRQILQRAMLDVAAMEQPCP